jgi:diacylglycerol kinase (ATP)
MSMSAAPERLPVRRAILLLNRKARRGEEAIDGLIERLEAGGIEVVKQAFCGSDEVDDEIRANAQGADCAIVCGGDGTLNKSAAPIVEAGLVLGILPMGTANDLARTLGIPDDLDAAADVILAGHARAIDLGSVNGEYFFNVASIGLSAELSRTLDTSLKRRWGRLSYAIAALKVLSRARPFTAWIEREGGARTKVRTLQVTVGSGRHYGGGVVVEETAEIDDGRLDLYSLEMRNVWKLALMLRTFRSGMHGAWSEVRTARGTAFEIRTKSRRPVYADGELVAATPAAFRVHPKAITVLAPKQ